MSSRQSRPHSNTLRMEVKNMGFLIDRLGEDCAPLQFLRELTQNSIEAILALPNRSGEVRWDVDWNTHELTGVYKLAIVDTGVGMTGQEMEQYINHLSSSVRAQSTGGNYGVGAKIAAAPRNRAGLIYLSWKDGVGHQIWLWRDPETNEYGLRKFDWPDGTASYWAHVDDELKPEPIKDHGTMVVLFGNSDDEDTMIPPEGTPVPSGWVLRYLNSRYYEFPEEIVVHAREGWENSRRDTRHNFLRQVTGVKSYLERSAMISGRVSLNGATAHWWILRAGEQADTAGRYIPNGHIGALYQNELYELQSGRAGIARLQEFGVIFGAGRVVIYVEPQNGKARRLTTNTARTQMLLDGQSLPWSDWAEEFRNKMPSEITEFMDQLAAMVPPDHTDAIRERLKTIRDLFQFSRYRQVKKGPFYLDERALLPGAVGTDKSGSGGMRNGSGDGSGGRGNGKGTGLGANIYALFQGTEGTQGTQTRDILEPQTKWISVETETREPGDLEDRAARYLEDQHVILINADCRVFKDMVDRWRNRYSQVKGAKATIESVVREWFEQQLIEAVLGGHALRAASNQWTTAELANIWSPEALTAVVLPRYHVEINVKRTLGAKLGSLKEHIA